MIEVDLIIRNVDAWQPSTHGNTNIICDKGKIVAIQTDVNNYRAKSELDGQGKTLLPGIIDSQVHFREPGLEHKETIATGTKSAILGGVTRIIEMPNTSPPTTSTEALQ